MKKRRGVVFALVALCIPLFARTVAAEEKSGEAEKDLAGEARKIFADAGVEGCFVVKNLATGETLTVNPELADQGFRPASTFKIPNTLIGLETGVIPGADFTLKWNGVRSDFVESWNRDHDLKSAMKNSVLWYYQEIARRAGLDAYREWLDKLDYGNKNPGGGVDRFWVEGDLRITPLQQIRFLERMLTGELPVQARNIEILKDIVLAASADGAVLKGKTGLTEQEPHKVGWLTGWIEDSGTGPTHVFACLVLGPSSDEWRQSPVFRARRDVPLRLLKRFGAVPPSMPQPN